MWPNGISHQTTLQTDSGRRQEKSASRRTLATVHCSTWATSCSRAPFSLAVLVPSLFISYTLFNLRSFAACNFLTFGSGFFYHATQCYPFLAAPSSPLTCFLASPARRFSLPAFL